MKSEKWMAYVLFVAVSLGLVVMATVSIIINGFQIYKLYFFLIALLNLIATYLMGKNEK